MIHQLPSDQPDIRHFLTGKSEHTLSLFNHFIDEFRQLGAIELCPTKTMIAIDNGHHRAAWVTQMGRNFIHVVFPFKQAYEDNLCFQKVGQVPGSQQFNHHLRILLKEDINEEVKKYMKMAVEGGH